MAGLRARDLIAIDDRLDNDLPHHTAVVDAVVAGAPDQAEAAMRKLVEKAASDVGATPHTT